MNIKGQKNLMDGRLGRLFYPAAVVIIFVATLFIGHNFLSDYFIEGNGPDETFYLSGTEVMHHEIEKGVPFCYYLNPGFIAPQVQSVLAPLLHLLSQPLFLLETRTVETFRKMNYLHFFLLLMAIYALTANLFGPKAGILAALMTATFPSTLVFMWFYDPFVLAAAMIAASLYFLLSSNNYRKMSRTILAGLAMAGALLSLRGSPIFILIPPFTLFTLFAFRDGFKKRVIRAAFLIVFIALGFSWKHLYYYMGSHFYGEGSLWDFVTNIKQSPHFQLLQTGLTENPDIFFYIKDLFTHQITFVSAVVLFPLAALLGWKGMKDKRYWVLLATSFLPILWFSLLSQKTGEYLYPVVPLFSTIIAGGIYSIEHPRIRKLLVVIMIITTVTFGWLFPAIDNPSRDFSFSFLSKINSFGRASGTPGLTVHCRQLIGLFDDYEDGEVAVLISWNSKEFPNVPHSVEIAENFLACVSLVRTDLPSALLQFNPRMDDDLLVEIWVFQKGTREYATTVKWSDHQRSVLPKMAAACLDFAESEFDIPGPPPGNIFVFSDTFGGKKIIVRGLY